MSILVCLDAHIYVVCICVLHNMYVWNVETDYVYHMYTLATRRLAKSLAPPRAFLLLLSCPCQTFNRPETFLSYVFACAASIEHVFFVPTRLYSSYRGPWKQVVCFWIYLFRSGTTHTQPYYKNFTVVGCTISSCTTCESLVLSAYLVAEQESLKGAKMSAKNTWPVLREMRYLINEINGMSHFFIKCTTQTGLHCKIRSFGEECTCVEINSKMSNFGHFFGLLCSQHGSLERQHRLCDITRRWRERVLLIVHEWHVQHSKACSTRYVYMYFVSNNSFAFAQCMW